jgi:hypothetical protein
MKTARGHMKILPVGQYLHYERLRDDVTALVAQWQTFDRSAEDWETLSKLIAELDKDLKWLDGM